MPASVSVNMMTVVHAGSSGVTMIFPDICKTPAPPAPPIPIPYPNVAQSSDTADGSTTVKVDGNPIMLKSSNFRMSTGDEAGSLFGVASNKVKGKAEPVNYSFDVKVDGQNVFRLSDLMLQNAGSPANTATGTEVQPPKPATPEQLAACERVKDKKKNQKKEGTSWGKSGIVHGHKGKIQTVSNRQKVILYFRATKPDCKKWIQAKHQPKPHSCLNGTTITGDNVGKVQAFLDNHFDRMDQAERHLQPRTANPMLANLFYSRRASDYIGVVGVPLGDYIKPMKGKGRQMGANYNGKWMTGDYDLFQVLEAQAGCKEAAQTGTKFAQVKRDINKTLKWDAIQHGPQAQWKPKPKELGPGVTPFDMRKEVKSALKTEGGENKTVVFHKDRKPMAVLDAPLTIVAGNGVVLLEDAKDVKDALICKGCDE